MPPSTSDSRPERPARADELGDLVLGCPWLVGVLETVAEVDPPDAWVGAGVVRDLVWDSKFGAGFDPGRMSDVDVGFFDPSDLRPERDLEVEGALALRRPDVPWQAKNQAAVHVWYPARFGVEVAPLQSMADAVATFPETATAVAIRLLAGDLEVLAPYGLDDLLDGIWRRNPRRATLAEYRRRLASKQPASRFPGITVVEARR